jgi:hypothetical protein
MRWSEIQEWDDAPEYVTTSQKEVILFVKRVQQDCGQFLSHKGSDNLFRGINHTSDGSGLPFIYDKPIRDRGGKYTSREQLEFIHSLMAKDGFKSTRLNSIFCKGDPNVSSFGPRYVIYPIGEYTMTWYDSRKVGTSDLGYEAWIDRGMASFGYSTEGKTWKQAATAFWENNKQFFHQGNSLPEAVSAESEITVFAPGYHAITYDKWEEYEVGKRL